MSDEMPLITRESGGTSVAKVLMEIEIFEEEDAGMPYVGEPAERWLVVGGVRVVRHEFKPGIRQWILNDGFAGEVDPDSLMEAALVELGKDES